MSTEPHQERSPARTWLIVLGTVGGLVVLAACGGLLVWGLRTTLGEIPAVQAAATAFLDDLQAGRIADAYGRTTAGHRARRSREQFEAFVKQSALLQTHASRSVTGVHVFQKMAEKTARVQVTVLGGTTSLSFTLLLRHEDDGWQVHDLTVP